MDRYTDAAGVLRRALRIREDHFARFGGSDHAASLASACLELADLLEEQEVWAEAESFAKRAIGLYEAVGAGGADAATTLALASAHNRLGLILRSSSSELSVSTSEFRTAILYWDAGGEAGRGDPQRALGLNALATNLWKAGGVDEVEEAGALLRQAVGLAESHFGRGSDMHEALRYGLTALEAGEECPL